MPNSGHWVEKRDKIWSCWREHRKHEEKTAILIGGGPYLGLLRWLSLDTLRADHRRFTSREVTCNMVIFAITVLYYD